jgi:hypothetical protein
MKLKSQCFRVDVNKVKLAKLLASTQNPML